MKILRILIFAGLIAAVIAGAVLWYHGVSNELTDADKEYIPKFTDGIAPASFDSSYEDQIAFIKDVQNAVMNIAPVNKGLPYGQEREPRNLYDAKLGLCFDRSRVIEKILRHHGFRTRHIFLYSVKDSNTISAFATPGVPSHAITEVLTERGWLVVDSNDRWVSLDDANNPRGMDDLRNAAQDEAAVNWLEPPPPIYRDIAPAAYVYGLYSRHGEFYPPYNAIPDVNYSELIENF